TTSISVNIKNTGAKTWTNKGDNFAALNLTEPKGRTSDLRHASWPLAYRPTIMDSDAVAPDKIATFTFELDLPPQAQDYHEHMQVVIEHVTFISGTEFDLHLVVTNPYQSKLEERPIVIYAIPGEQRGVTVNISNQSNLTWKSNGSGFVALELKDIKTSVLAATDWVSATRPIKLARDVSPGQTAVLTFNIQIPNKIGEFTEVYHLVSDSQTAVDGSTFTLRVIAKLPYAAKLLTTNNTVSVASGATSRVTVEVKNIGSQAWRATDNAVKVVTNQPLKHASSFATKSWPNKYSPTSLEPAVVAPEQIARLTIEVAPSQHNGSDSERFTLIDPTGAVILGSAFEISRVTTGNDASGPAGPNLRVGIYSSTSAIAVEATASYDVLSGTTKLGTVSKGRTSVNWNGSAYAVSGALNKTGSEPIRFRPVGNTILTLPDYEDRPTWKPSLNDNAFRGSVEVRRANNGRLYAINELPLEHYMWGLAEASNDQNAGYLKVLAIAARTYAEYQRSIGGKHPSEGYDVDNKNDQVYKGYNLEQRNTNFVDAVKATAGQFVTYQGEIVVTPYFSQSDGHTRAFHEVFGGEVKPWLVSVSVPENQGKPLLGHGVGLDASAAYARAVAGQSPEQILKYFYTSTALTKKY
ncbi:MAG: SpoIID/LytB domain-containing protein, partial [Parcubacteria group bacterium]